MSYISFLGKVSNGHFATRFGTGVVIGFCGEKALDIFRNKIAPLIGYKEWTDGAIKKNFKQCLVEGQETIVGNLEKLGEESCRQEIEYLRNEVGIHYTEEKIEQAVQLAKEMARKSSSLLNREIEETLNSDDPWKGISIEVLRRNGIDPPDPERLVFKGDRVRSQNYEKELTKTNFSLKASLAALTTAGLFMGNLLVFGGIQRGLLRALPLRIAPSLHAVIDSKRAKWGRVILTTGVVLSTITWMSQRPSASKSNAEQLKRGMPLNALMLTLFGSICESRLRLAGCMGAVAGKSIGSLLFNKPVRQFFGLERSNDA